MAEADRDCRPRQFQVTSTGISDKMEGENPMEKRLRVFRAHSRIFLWRSVKIVAPRVRDIQTPEITFIYKNYSPRSICGCVACITAKCNNNAKCNTNRKGNKL